VKRHITADIGDLVQVKSVHKATHRLLVPLKDAYLTGAVFVLVQLHELPTVVLGGWCDGSFVIRPERIDNGLPVPAYTLHPARLGPMNKLATYLKHRLASQDAQTAAIR
jgi:hypothetical protein